MVDRLLWAPFVSLVHKELMRFVKVLVQTVVTPLISTSLYLLIFGVSLGKNIQLEGGLTYLAFLIPGLVMMSCLQNSYQNASSSIVSSKYSGDLEDLRVVPLSSQQIVWALGIGGISRGLAVGGITFIVGQVFNYVMDGSVLGVAHPGVLVFFLCVGGLAFAKLGMTVAFWARSVDQLTVFSSFVILPLLYLGGVFFSIDSLHPFWQWLSQFNPMLYFINGVRYGLIGVSDVSLLRATVISLVALAGFHLMALYTIKYGNYRRW